MSKNYYKILVLTIMVSFGFISKVSAQLSGWNYSFPIDIINKTSSARTNYQELIIVNTKTLITAGKMQSTGADIRFGDNCSGTINLYSHFIHADLNTDSTKIWVNVTSIPANSTVTIFMYYGNTGASTTSSFSAVFPNAKKSGGPNDSIGGVNNYDWFELEANDTFFIKMSSFTEINARVAIIKGAIFGNGAGNISTSLSSDGNGSGGGKTSSNKTAGSGGAGYGNNGGDGGYDAGDAYGVGGSANGTQTGTDITMGSSGGSSDLVLGGAGGGVIKIKAEYIDFSGTICVNGTAGKGGQARNAGGGSGGGAMIWGSWVYLNGNIIATGGNGGVGTSTANDDGGGGSGGRAKVFYKSHLSGSLSTTLAGGKGGPYGTALPGQDGGTGTSYKMERYFGGDSIVPSTLDIKLSETDKRVCAGTPITITAKTGFTNYKFYQNTSLVYSGTSNVYTYKNLKNLDSLSVEGVWSTCFTDKKYAIVIVDTIPDVVIISDTSVCSGDSLKLKAFGAKTYSWTNGPKTDNWVLIPVTSDNYTVIGKDNNGCVDTTTKFIPMYYFPSYTGSNSQSMCAGDSVQISVSGATNVIWESSIYQPSIYVKPASTKYFHFIAFDNPACVSSDSLEVVVNPLPNVYISGKNNICLGQNVTLGGNGALYFKWNSGNTNYLENLKLLTTTTVWVIGTDDKGCSNIAYKTVTVDTPATISINGDMELCKGESTTLTAFGASTYLWSSGGKNASETVKPAATITYSVITLDAKSCIDTTTATVVVHDPPVVTFTLPDAIDTLCLNAARQALSGASPAGGNYSGNGVGADSINPVSTGLGKYYVKYVYQDNFGCKDSATDIITIVNCVNSIYSWTGESIKLFPNPSDGSAIHISAPDGFYKIFGVTGAEIRAFEVRGKEWVMDLSNLPNGTYWIKGVNISAPVLPFVIVH
ncbi:MAG: DUF2341 domain-containing protein [Bacteroidetes bacterium]|nr:DUF2341 domain-containing protein [Bacteroidota bacterium]